METTDTVAALAALAQEHRLAIFRLLVQAGPRGLPAGQVAETLSLAPNTLTFHFDRLRLAGLVTVAARGPLDDLCGAVRDHERAARLPHRKLLPGLAGKMRAGDLPAGQIQMLPNPTRGKSLVS